MVALCQSGCQALSSCLFRRRVIECHFEATEGGNAWGSSKYGFRGFKFVCLLFRFQKKKVNESELDFRVPFCNVIESKTTC